MIGSPEYDGPHQASGKVDIYTLDYNFPAQWILHYKLFQVVITMEDLENAIDVNYDGSRIIIGEKGANGGYYGGKAIIYEFNGSSYSMMTELNGQQPNDYFWVFWYCTSSDGTRVSVDVQNAIMILV